MSGDPGDKEPRHLKDWFSSIPTIAAATSGISLAIAVVYNVHYFVVIDYRFLQLTSFEDHINSALIFLPFVLVVSWISFGELVRSPETYINHKWVILVSAVSALAVLVITFVIFPLTETLYKSFPAWVVLVFLYYIVLMGLYYTVQSLWWKFLPKQPKPSEAQIKRTLIMSLATNFLSMVYVTVALVGLIAGLIDVDESFDLDPRANGYRLSLSDGEVLDDVRLLRSLQAGTVVVEGSGVAAKLAFYPWSRIESVERSFD